jgi:hypothetical protein
MISALSMHDQRSQSTSVRAVARGTHDGDDLLHLGRIGRIAQTFVVRRSAGVEAPHGRR